MEVRDKVCLKNLEEVLAARYDKDEYSLDGPKDSSVCIEQKGSYWCVYESEKASENDLRSYDTIIEACLDMISRMGLDKKSVTEMKNDFFDKIIVKEIA